MTLKNSRILMVVSAAFLLMMTGCARSPLRHPGLPGTLQPSPIGRVPAPLVTHQVEHGETLYRIAKKYRVDVGELMRANAIQDPALLKTGQVLVIPGTAAISEKAPLLFEGAGMSLEEVRRVVGPKVFSSDWRTITLHHSATSKGSAKLFHRDHMRRRMGGLFYHFVIGNGSYTGDGLIEKGWRWKKQVKANRPYDIQICLVGNFSQTEVSAAQLESVINLVRVLREQYGISINNIRRHDDIKGKNTECPGKFFPFHRILSEVSKDRRS